MELHRPLIEHSDNRIEGLPIRYVRTEQSNPEGIVVLMPAALNPNREDRERIFYTRSRWADAWPGHEVICFADPALQQDSRLSGAWFIHPEHDIIAALADVVSEIAIELKIPSERIIIYGSSLGGVRCTYARFTHPWSSSRCRSTPIGV